MSSLQGYVDRRIFLVLQDGRAIVVCITPFTYFTPHRFHREKWPAMISGPT